MTHTRRLVAIMFTDMVGFTALMQHDEALGLKKRQRHKEVFESEHRKFNGEIIQYFGDGTLSIFSNSYDAVECAIEIQKSLKEPIEVPLRIGIHTGHAIIEEDGIIGDAINIASRIESFANPGGVFISDTVYDQVRNQTQLEFISQGKFSLKNINRPFEIFAVAAEGLNVPPVNYLRGKGERIAPLKTDIPEPSGPLIGREKEMEDLLRLMNENRIVTITGTGGVGKTRIAQEICKIQSEEFKDGIAYVSMATLSDAEEVIPTLANALDIKEAHDRELIDGIAALISDKKGLIVLDNLEQVISAAKEIASLLASCPNLKILCTSRTPLKIQSEAEYSLNPLSIPETNDFEKIKGFHSVEMFVRRARQTNIDFELTEENARHIVEICQRVDGLPLAIELAAARIKILTPEKLLERLSRSLDILTTGSKDLPERHQRLRTTIGWSYSLLNEPEKRLFRRLSVFNGGFTLEAVESVCYANDEDDFLAIDELESLIDKGLVVNRKVGARFGLLQTINDFASEKLVEFGEQNDLQLRHAAYYAEVAIKLDEGVQGKDQTHRMKQGLLEEANIFAALDYLLEDAKNGNLEAREKGLDICGDLWMYWHIRGKHRTAKRYVIEFIDTSENKTVTKAYLKALFTLNLSLNLLGELELGEEYALKACAESKEFGDKLEIAKAYFMAGMAYLFLDIQKALEYSEACLVILEELNLEYWLALSFWQRGLLLFVAGQPLEAKELFAKALPLAQKINDNEVKGAALSGLAITEMIEGNFDSSIELYQQSLIAFKTVGDRPEEARVYSELAWHYINRKNTHLGRKYALESIQAHQEVGSMRGVGTSMLCFAALEGIKGNPLEAVKIASAAESFGRQEGVVVVNGFGLNNQGKIFLDEAKAQLSASEIDQAEKQGSELTLGQVLEMVDNKMVAVA